MKTISHLPLLSVMWLSGGMLWAKEPSTPAAPASTSAFATSSKPVAMAPSDQFPHTLRLSAGTLGQILGEVEDYVQVQAVQPGSTLAPEDAADAMSNLIYDPETEKLPVPTSLFLRNVTPLQAVTLVAAAAGCTLEPVTAPAGEGSGAAQADPPVIGYRVVKASRPPAAAFTETFSARLPDPEHIAALRKKLEALQANLAEKHPALTELRDELAHLEQMKTDVLKRVPPGAPGTTTIRVVEPLPGGVGITQLQNGGNFLLERHTTSGTGSAASASAAAGTAAAPAAPGSPASFTTSSGPTVRIYALGALLAGRSEAEVKVAQDDMQRLFASALDQADLDNPGPDLFFHDATKVLVAKGSAAQHDLISQVLTALKENQLADTPAQKP